MLPLLLSLSLAITSAEAKDSGPYMWGGGPTLLTIAYPGQHPLAYPKDIRDNFDEKVRGDIGFGAKGAFYINKEYRANAQLVFGTGSGIYKSTEFVFGADKILGGESGGYAFAGAGLGFGKMKFQGNEEAELDLSTYIIRGQVGGYYRLKQAAIELDLFAEFIWPGVQTYTTPQGNTVNEDQSGGNYLLAGLQATAYFGDFTPPKNKKNKKDKKKGDKKKK